MRTLRDIWIDKGMNSFEVAHQARCSIPTIYKLNRKGKEADAVAFGSVKRVCAVLNLSLDEFAALDACPKADQYRQK